MYRYIFLALLCIIPFVWMPKAKPNEPVKVETLTKVWTGSKSLNSRVKIRMLIIRHAPDRIAVIDGNYAEDAVEVGKREGLDIEVIGNFYVTSLDQFESVVNENIGKQAISGDTLIVHTIGHGYPGGGLMNLGQRSGVMDVLVNSAESHRQEMLWWQLSCYASARLPDMNNSLFSNLASSNATRTSGVGVEGPIMERIFIALAKKSITIDPNGDATITAGELRDFLGRRGNLLYAQSDDEPIFGVFGYWDIPIVDRTEKQKEYDRNYMPIP